MKRFEMRISDAQLAYWQAISQRSGYTVADIIRVALDSLRGIKDDVALVHLKHAITLQENQDDQGALIPPQTFGKIRPKRYSSPREW